MSEPTFRPLCQHHPLVNWKIEWGCPECLRDLRTENSRLKHKIHIALEGWRAVIQRNKETQKALADKGLFEQSARVHSDDMMIESFIKELVELQ